MSGYGMNSKGLIEGFINEHVTRKGLDDRTKKAYQLDLEHFSAWLNQKDGYPLAGTEEVERDNGQICLAGKTENSLEEWVEVYLDYLAQEKNLSSATVCRKSKVLDYYLSYLARQGVIARYRTRKIVRRLEQKSGDKNLLSKRESDAFFAAMNREYEELDSEFRKRICLRDIVMMELLFYQKIDISELLCLEVSDYDRKTGMLTIRQKKGRVSYVYLFSQGLRKKMGEWLEEREQMYCEGQYRNRMFVSKLGKPLSMKMVIKIFDKYRELAGIEKGFTPRDLKENCMKRYARELVMEMYK